MEWMGKWNKVGILKTIELYILKRMNFIASELYLNNKKIEKEWR